ncbi:DUF3817 domain-containing protein [Pseudonocardia phyllosphaerae]|uniref:DUF3817 domain-containing protein n=1 Tax=Pseudonocardia phyllosphaerae TaxID=3390502 RepID=UPI00397AE437
MPAPSTLARILRIVAVAEACSWVGLLIGMFVKWVLAISPIGVQIMGPIHGVLFIAYLLVTVAAGFVFRWRPVYLLIGLLASLPPLTTLWFESHARRAGRLAPRTAETAAH